MNLVVTLFYSNDRSLSISTLTVQICKGAFFGQTESTRFTTSLSAERSCRPAVSAARGAGKGIS
jgi:hypothetical protein